MFVRSIILTFVIIGHVFGGDTTIDDVDWATVDLPKQFLINEFRNINGSGNNVRNPEYGTAFGETVRCVPPVFGDGYNSLTGEFRLNPREISNVLFRQFPEESPQFVNSRSLTQFAWQWGQFIDHDLTLISEDRHTNDFNLDIDIYIPCCDITYDPNCVCGANKTMNVFRTRAIDGTGTGPGNPRKIFNDITAFVDGSMVYGSDDDRAAALRSFSNGLLKVSSASNGDELLPFNTAHIPNEPNDGPEFFIGGDVRVNEQTGLLFMHTILVRAHNHLAQGVIESVKNNFVGLTHDELDEYTYQYTKAILTGIIQKITYKDWLPVLFGPTAIKRFLGDWLYYDQTVNPGICAIFASSAYRLGHTFLPQMLPRRTKTCAPIPAGVNPSSDLPLRDAFFLPEIVGNNPETMNDIVNGFSCTLANEVDTRITDGVRDFLFESALDENGDSIFGPLDLISLNLQRGRDHGLPDYNTVRGMIGLPKWTSFDNISSNAELNEDFENLYLKDINNIDLFGGLLAEDHFPDGSFGETISKIVLSQFKRTRDGDRFWYENYIKKGCIRLFIESVTLKDILEWTTNMDIETLDANNNIFQNTRAVSIFEDTTETSGVTPFAKQDNANNGDNTLNYIKKDSFVTQLISNPIQLIVVIFFGIVLSCILGLYIGRRYSQLKTVKQYRAVSVDTDTQGSSTDV